jgi:hypothetical protein
MNNIVRPASLIVLLLFLCHTVQGQITIQGTITDKSGVSIQGVSVSLNPQGKGNVLAYSISDEKGYYRINYTGTIDSLQLTLTSFDYKKVIRMIEPVSQKINFTLEEEPIILNEVVVKAIPISQKGDTLSYLVSSFASENDRVIGDVLKKLPGFEVSADGAIQYNGKSINKFYIENLDLLQGRYSIATNNISAKDVASVEVFEYHQPIKALAETNFTDKAAVNLKLKNNAKGTLNAMAQLGVGASPLLWENELVALYFAKSKQNITTYKGNNSGNDVSRELTSFYSDGENSSYNGKFLSSLSPAPPAIRENRYLFNNVNAVSTNLLYLLPREYQLTTNITYNDDVRTRDSYSRSSYYLSNDSVLTLEEQRNSRQKINNVDAAIKIMANKEDFYFVDALNINALWDSNKGPTMNLDTIHQNLATNTCNLSNTFEMVKTLSNKNTIRFHSYNGYSRTPQNLTIQPGIYEDVLTDGKEFDKLLQKTVFNNFTSKNYAFFSTKKHRFIQNYTAGLDVTIQDLNSSLLVLQANDYPIHNIPDSLQNDLQWQKYKAYITGNYIYTWKKFRIEASLAVSYNHLFINNHLIPTEKSTINRILCDPNISVLYTLNKYLDMKAAYSFNHQLGTIQESYTGYILQDYRNFNRHDGQLADYKMSRYMVGANYRNAFKALFANGNLIYETHHSNRMMEQNFMGTLLVQNTLPVSVLSKTFGAGGSVSKNIYALRSTLSLAGSYYKTSSSQMSQGDLVGFDYNTWTIKPTIESQITSWAGFSYSCLWNESATNIENRTSDYPSVRSISNRLTTRFFIAKNTTLILGYEHYYTNAVSESRGRSFTDISFNYKLKTVDFLLAWTNIFNSKEYVTSVFDETSKFIHIYEIRPSQILLTARFKLF